MFPIEIARTCNISTPFLGRSHVVFWMCGLILLDLSTEAMVTTVTTMATTTAATAATATRIMAATDMEASPVCFYVCAFLRVLQNVKSVKPLHWARERSKGRPWCQQYCLFPHVLHQVVRTCTYPKTGCSCLAKIIWNFGVVSSLFCLLEVLCHPSYKDTRKESVCTHAGWNEGRYSTPTKTRGMAVRTFWKHINWMSTAIIAVPCRKAL